MLGDLPFPRLRSARWRAQRSRRVARDAPPDARATLCFRTSLRFTFSRPALPDAHARHTMSSSSLPGASHSSGAASAVASSSRLTLDLDCPIPWPSAAAGDDDALPDAAAPRVALPLRYYETLWLGEVFSSLPTLVHASHTLLRHAPAGDVRTALLGLLRAPMPRTAGGLEERVRGTTHAQLVALLLHGEAPPDWSETEVHVVRAALRSGPGSAVAAEIRDQMRVRQERQAAAAAEEAQAAQEDPEEEESHGKLARRWLSAIGMRE